MSRYDHVVLSCEHASDRVPAAWRQKLQAALPPHAWQSFCRDLQSHRGVDFGTLALGRALAKLTGRPLFASRHSRLLVDCNRSAHHPRRLSAYSRALAPADQAKLVAEAWQPHRGQVEAAVARAVAKTGRALHLALHSFTPVWEGVPRAVELGLLYDPSRPGERQVVAALQPALRQLAGAPRVRRNAPYRGVADGLPTALRRLWRAQDYVGLELEVSQAITLAPPAIWAAKLAQLAQLLASCLCKNF